MDQFRELYERYYTDVYRFALFLTGDVARAEDLTADTFVRAWTGMMVPWTIFIADRDELYVIGSSPSRWEPSGTMVGIPPKDQIVMRLTSDFKVLSWWAFSYETLPCVAQRVCPTPVAESESSRPVVAFSWSRLPMART